MDSILLKKIAKIAIVIVSPLTIFAFLLFNKQPEIALAFFIGAFLGILRLKTFWSYINNALKGEKSNNKAISLAKYLINLALTFGVVVFVLYKSLIVGLALLLGLITVPIIVTGYAAAKGITLYREK